MTSKFAGFDRLIEEAGKDGTKNVIIAFPWVLGDNYEEVMDNMSKLAKAGLALHIAKPNV
ncbi:MAG TPA: hypothetical protein VII94_05815 [Candidatus Saccharimonadales bacterium]